MDDVTHPIYTPDNPAFRVHVGGRISRKNIVLRTALFQFHVSRGAYEPFS